MWKVCFTSRKLDWKSISVVAVVGRMFYIPPRPHYTVDKKNQWEERLKGWEKVKWKYVFQVGRIWDFFWWKWFWMINECEMKNLDGTVAQENYGVLSDRHKPWTANCFFFFYHSPSKRATSFHVVIVFYFYICEAYLLIGWILLIIYRTHFFSRCSTLLLENY